MKHSKVSIPVTSFLEAGGTLNVGDILYCKAIYLDVIFIELFKSEHNDDLIRWKTIDSDKHLPITINSFMITTDIVLKSDLQKIITDAYNMGAFHHNSMARALHKDIQSKNLEDYLKEVVG